VRVSDLRVAGIVYLVSDSGITGIWVRGEERRPFAVGSLAEIVPQVDALRDELRNSMSVARGRVPRLAEFAQAWGRELLPPPALAEEVDVLVVIPHSLLHGLPLHVVETDLGVPLGKACGVTYASSQTLFARCVERNAARRLDPNGWAFDAGDGAEAAGHFTPTSFQGGGCDVISGEDEAFVDIAAGAAARVGVEFKPFDDFRYSRIAAKAMWRKNPPEIQCIVAHGYLDAEDHRFSGLLLGRDPGVLHRPLRIREEVVHFPDWPLRALPKSVPAALAAEILTAAELQIEGRSTTQLVALLGCSAGWSRMLEGDEPASVAQTFLQLGTPTVAAPLWDSRYDATRDWSEAFFDEWTRGAPKALAARHALGLLHDDGQGPERYGCLALRGDWL
jgi:hypothetical protein